MTDLDNFKAVAIGVIPVLTMEANSCIDLALSKWTKVYDDMGTPATGFKHDLKKIFDDCTHEQAQF